MKLQTLFLGLALSITSSAQVVDLSLGNTTVNTDAYSIHFMVKDSTWEVLSYNIEVSTHGVRQTYPCDDPNIPVALAGIIRRKLETHGTTELRVSKIYARNPEGNIVAIPSRVVTLRLIKTS